MCCFYWLVQGEKRLNGGINFLPFLVEMTSVRFTSLYFCFLFAGHLSLSTISDYAFGRGAGAALPGTFLRILCRRVLAHFINQCSECQPAALLQRLASSESFRLAQLLHLVKDGIRRGRHSATQFRVTHCANALAIICWHFSLRFCFCCCASAVLLHLLQLLLRAHAQHFDQSLLLDGRFWSMPLWLFSVYCSSLSSACFACCTFGTCANGDPLPSVPNSLSPF
ncbi:hypothetical protein niasHT_012650 [Heterodera trifolii]|uniref:Secreted protein n=1 Tax=Heterodera trifolii TaxID=157864 RepID=A0ABD2L1I9_9BILA